MRLVAAGFAVLGFGILVVLWTMVPSLEIEPVALAVFATGGLVTGTAGFVVALVGAANLRR